jgi:GR25 family glycosyltransferase involved in LPS biosynthesis
VDNITSHRQSHLLDIYLIKLNDECTPQKNSTKLTESIIVETLVPEINPQEENIDFNYLQKVYNIRLSSEEIITFQYHRLAWRKFIISEKSYCLIIEDNVSLNDDIKLFDHISDLPAGWDISFPFDKLEESPVTENFPYFLKLYWGSCVYFISRSGALKLLDIQQIKRPLDDEILFQAASGQLELYSGKSESFFIDFNKAYVHQGRKREIANTISAYNAWSPSHYELIQGILKIITSIAKKKDVHLMLHGGSLLGWVRHDGILPWDDDVDIGIHEGQFLSFAQGVIEDGRLGMMQRLELHTNAYYYKIWSDAGDNIQGFPYKFPFVDLWLYRTGEEDLLFHNGIIFPNVLKRGFQKALFENSEFDVPVNHLDCLDSFYPGWRNNLKIYPFCHRLERLSNKPFQTPISTDSAGKFLGYRTH